MAISARQMLKKAPLIVVLGASACGKSKLAVDLARKFGGEVISADSMQVYKGLDIVTNKVSHEEMAMVKHHMIDIVDPKQHFSIVDFRDQVIPIIDNIHQRNHVPIVVGGTNYYIESIVWNNFLINEDSAQKSSDGCTRTLLDTEDEKADNLTGDQLHTDDDLVTAEKLFAKPIYTKSFDNISSEKLWKILETLDSSYALRVHPSDRRKITRALQVIQRTKRKFSDLLLEMNRTPEGKSLRGGPLRFENTYVIWLNCEKASLRRRINQRVRQMVERGLLDELLRFHDEHVRVALDKGQEPDYESGILQMIGFKELREYLMMDEEGRKSEAGIDALERGIKEVKNTTRRYAKNQLKFIESKFLRKDYRNTPSVYKIETTFDEELWPSEVLEPAFAIIQSHLFGEPLVEAYANLKCQLIDKQSQFVGGQKYCDYCDRTFYGSNNIETHFKSKSHWRRVEYCKTVKSPEKLRSD